MTTLHTDTLHRRANAMNRLLDEIDQWTDAELVKLHTTATNYQGPNNAGWNGILLARATEVMKQRGLKA